MLAIQSVDQSVGIIGKNVDFQTPTGSSQSGTVKAVSFRTGDPRLTVDVSGTIVTDVRLSDVMLVR
jgi:hypothetical protein